MKSRAYRMAMLFDFYGDVMTERQKEFYAGIEDFWHKLQRDVPGIPLALCSVHSRMTCTRLPFAFFAIFSYVFRIQ